MTQHHIRKNAGFPWWRRAFMQLHEPRIVSAIYGGAYILATVVGAVTVFYPPITIEGLAGDVSMRSIALALTIGGVTGVITIAKGVFWIERYAVGIITAALGFHLLLTSIVAWLGSGHRQLTLLALVLAIAFILMRSFWIFRSPYRLITGKTLHR